MKRIAMIIVLVLMIGIVGCSFGESVTEIDKAKELIRNDNYEKAIEELTKLVDEDELNIEAWDLIADSYIKGEMYDEADEWLRSYLEMVESNIDNEKLNIKKAIDSIGDYGRDIRRNGETVGEWYTQLIPASVNLDRLEWEYDLGTTLELDVPDHGTVLYTLNGENPRTEGIVYKDGILLDTEGYVDLSVLVTNKYQEYSSTSYAFIEVYDMSDFVEEDTDSDTENDDTTTIVELLDPILEIESGTYEGPLEISLINYTGDEENITVRYTIDGSDPRIYDSNYMYYYEYVILGPGQHVINFVASDYETEEFSEVISYEFYVEIEDSVKVGLFNLPDVLIADYKNLFNTAANYGMYVEPIVYYGLEEIDYNNLPDALISYGSYAEDLSSFGVIADVEQYYDMSKYNYFANADAIGEFNGVKYMMPLTIRPEYLLYGDHQNIGLVDWEYLKDESEWYEKRFVYPSNDPTAFLGIYYGFGGAVIDPYSDDIVLNKDIVIKTLNTIVTMPDEGVLDKLYTLEEMFTHTDNYSAEIFLMNNFGEIDSDYYNSYYQLGAMPLPEGLEARFYNTSVGLYLNAITAMMNPDKVTKVQELYDYLVLDNYDMLSIAEKSGSLPAEMSLLEQAEYYTYIPIDIYMAQIENGISSIRTYKLYTLYDGLAEPLNNLINGASVEEVADQIMEIQYLE